MSMLPPVIARRTLYCRPAGGAERSVNLLVRAPIPDPGRAGQWLCEAALEHLYQDVVQVRGVDSLQALQLALHAVREALESLLAAGGSLRWADGSAEMTIEDLWR